MRHMKVIFFISLSIAFCGSCFFASQTLSEETITRSNMKYLIYVENGTDLVIYDLQKNQSFKALVGCAIKDLEICPSYPFVSLTCTKERHNTSFLYDLEKRELYEGQFYLDTSEHRWSLSGEYTYFDKATSFLMVRTKQLRKYLQEPKDRQLYIEVIGHPLGAISQVTWIGDNLLYRTGVGEMECWGFLETTKRKNSLVSCCGMSRNDPCSRKARQDDSVIRLFILKSERGGLIPVSADFYNEVLRIERSSGRPH